MNFVSKHNLVELSSEDKIILGIEHRNVFSVRGLAELRIIAETMLSHTIESDIEEFEDLRFSFGVHDAFKNFDEWPSEVMRLGSMLRFMDNVAVCFHSQEG